VVARAQSLLRPADALGAAAAAIVLFLGAWVAIHHGFYRGFQIVDTPIYKSYGDRMARGEVPYRDFELEYPPAALPVFVLPSFGHEDQDVDRGFKRTFESLMLLCGAAALLCVALALRSLGAGSAALAGALALPALAPLALGPVLLSRFDLWPAFLTVAALAALVAGRLRLGTGVLALAVSAKYYPAVLVPLALAYAWRRRGLREAAACAAVGAAVLAACFVPFVVLAPGGVWHTIQTHAGRPLQVESLGAALLIGAHQLGWLGVTMKSGHGSQNLAGPAADALATAEVAAAGLVLVALWIAFARGPATGARLVRYAAAAVVAVVALGKVLSPQFVIWLIPLVPLVRGRRALASAGLLLAVLVLTGLYFPRHYWALALRFAAYPSWLLLARDLGLVALLAVLAWPDRPARAAPPEPRVSRHMRLSAVSATSTPNQRS
jgi:hypothetical protein